MAYKDGFVIEYTNQGSRISCYKCVYCNKHDRACDKVGVYIPDVARVAWKTCSFFELDDDYNTEEMRVKAERIRERAMAEEKQRKARKKKASKGNVKYAGDSEAAVQDSTGIATQKHPRKKLDGISEIIGVGSRVRSPRYGMGKVVEIDGDWVIAVFSKESKRVRFNLIASLKNGSLIV